MKSVPLENGTVEPVYLADLKTYLRLSSGDIEDRVLASMLRAARMSAETFARISISPRKWRTTFELPRYVPGSASTYDPDEISNKMKLRRPLLDVESVQIMSRTGNALPTPAYAASTHEHAVFWTNVRGLEPRQFYQEGAYMLVLYRAGYPLAPLKEGETDSPNTERVCVAPDDVQEAIRLIVADLYEHRGSDAGRLLPKQAQMLLRSVWQTVL